MDQADIFIKLSYRLILVLLQSGVNVDAVLTFTQLAGKFPDVNAHSAGVLCPDLTDGIGMDA